MSEAGKAIDPITLEVVRHKVDGIAEEMETTLLRSSYSTIVKEGLDASASLFAHTGETLSQAPAIPIHLSTLITVVDCIRAKFPTETMAPGDLFLMNDPYMGGTHLPDIGIIMPIFHDGTIVGFSGAMSHHQDVGGMSPGSVPTNAREVFQEGLRLPPLRLRQGDQFNETLLDILKLNSRVPDTVIGDIHAQVSACSVGAHRVAKLAETFGTDRIKTIFEQLLDESEKLTSAALTSLPQGTFCYEDWLDNDGVMMDQPVKIRAAVTIAEGRMKVDFSGSSKQVAGPFNAVPSGALAAAGFALRALTGNDIPTNGGCFRVLDLELPQGSIVNPEEPAPVNARAATIKRMTNVILSALREALPEKIPADPSGELLILAFGGDRPGGGRFVINDLITGGTGAGSSRDGVDVIESDATNCMSLPAEAIEMDAPLRMHRVALRTDSGGAGRYRGGLGTVREYEILAESVTLTHRGERHRFPANGAVGGAPGALAKSFVLRRNGEIEEVPSKAVIQLVKGDRVRVETAGGGGFGIATERPAPDVEADVLDGKISTASVKEIYNTAR